VARPDRLRSAPFPSAAAAPLPAGLPSSWHGAPELLATTAATLGTRAPVNTALLEAAAAPVPTANLAALWSVPQAPGRRDGHVVLRRLDGKGRLMLPLTLTHQTRTAAPAERTGAVLTVYLPGSPAEPAASRVVAPLPLDARGRLSWAPGTDLLISYDPDRAVLAICAASLLETKLLEALHDLREDPADLDAQFPREDNCVGPSGSVASLHRLNDRRGSAATARPASTADGPR
jgi:hypothetical protein